MGRSEFKRLPSATMSPNLHYDARSCVRSERCHFPSASSSSSVAMIPKIRPERERLDRALVSRGLVASREDAARLILAGLVHVDGMVVDKAAKPDSCRTLKWWWLDADRPMSGAAVRSWLPRLDHFKVDPKGMVCFDVGCSTGGFTDCLLQRGATRVYAVDVGYGQFDWRLRQDPACLLKERTNIRYLEAGFIRDPISLIVIDVSFISLTLVLPCVVPYLTDSGGIITLIKPQFEVGKGLVGRGGIVREDALREGSAEKVVACADQLGLELIGRIESPIEGRKGNREMLAWFRRRGGAVQPRDQNENALPMRGEGVV